MSPPAQLSYSEHSVPHLPQTHADRQTQQTDTPCTPCHAFRSNMFFAHLQQIKFPSKWISSLVAFGGQATLFSLIFILFPPTNDLLYSPLYVTQHSRSCFLPSCRRAVEFGPGNGKQLHCQKGVFWFIKRLKCYLFCSSLCPLWELSPDTQMRWSECWLLNAPSMESSQK